MDDDRLDEATDRAGGRRDYIAALREPERYDSLTVCDSVGSDRQWLALHG